MIRTAPIVFTAHTDVWRRLITALGGTVVVDSPAWTVVRAGRGVVALHEATDAKRGTTELWFEATEPEVAARATGGVVTAKELDGGAGTVWEARFPDGQMVGFSPLEGSSDGAPGRLSVLPIWVTTDVETASDALVKAGATGRIASDSGVWADLSVDDGLVAVHGGSQAGTVLSFEYDGDIDALAERVSDAGVEVRVIDETFGRTLRLDHPDGDEEIWVNERQTDLYGYHKG
ncbi:MAG: hypothetical protein Q4F67_17050 [Propionibacteriaceae bacterium]|nr:hypothetical protein [Propionibacteriaceae bacterium]